jgi:ribosomal protein S18 acetylase RimI-like enzyme
MYHMDNVIIKKVSLPDLEQLQTISKQTFIETFSDTNTEENLNIYLSEDLHIDRLKTEMRNPGSAFYFAILDKKIIGYLKINFGQAQTELKDNKAIEIERIYVLKEFLGKNIGWILWTKTLQIAKEINADYIWLGVWEKNQRAIHFYKKIGFVEFDKHTFKLGNDPQTDIMMKIGVS